MCHRNHNWKRAHAVPPAPGLRHVPVHQSRYRASVQIQYLQTPSMAVCSTRRSGDEAAVLSLITTTVPIIIPLCNDKPDRNWIRPGTGRLTKYGIPASSEGHARCRVSIVVVSGEGLRGSWSASTLYLQSTEQAPKCRIDRLHFSFVCNSLCIQ